MGRLLRQIHAIGLERFGPIEQPRWQDTVALYEFHGLLELWAGGSRSAITSAPGSSWAKSPPTPEILLHASSDRERLPSGQELAVRKAMIN